MSILREILAHLEKESAEDRTAIDELEKISVRLELFQGEEPAAVTYQRRETLIARLKASSALDDTDRMEWLEQHGCEQFLRRPYDEPEKRWFDTETPQSDFHPTLRAAIDGARACEAGRKCKLCDRILSVDYLHATCQQCIDDGKLL